MNVLILALSVVAATGPQEEAAPKKSVLIMPIQAEAGVDPALCKQVTSVLVNVAAGLPGYRVISQAEIAASMTQEMMKQASGCNSVSCAAEIAGALDTEQIVIGSLGKVGQSYLLTMSRINGRDAVVVGRAQRRFDMLLEDDIVDNMPGAAAELFGLPPPPTTAKGTAVQAGGATASGWVFRGFLRRMVLPLRIGAAGALAAGVLVGLANVAAWGVVAGVTVHDLSRGGRFPNHKILAAEAIVSDVVFAVGTGLTVVLVGLLVASAATFGTSWVLR